MSPRRYERRLATGPAVGLVAPEPRDNALVATDVDADAFTALFAERVLAQLDDEPTASGCASITVVSRPNAEATPQSASRRARRLTPGRVARW